MKRDPCPGPLPYVFSKHDPWKPITSAIRLIILSSGSKRSLSLMALDKTAGANPASAAILYMGSFEHRTASLNSLLTLFLRTRDGRLLTFAPSVVVVCADGNVNNIITTC